MRITMFLRKAIVYLCVSYFTISSAHLLSFDRLRSYAKYLDWDTLGIKSSGNELWNGIINDCSGKSTFSCIQKNAYTYLDNTFVDRDNITVFEGFVLRKNDLDYDMMPKRSTADNDVAENLVETSNDEKQSKSSDEDDYRSEGRIEGDEEEDAEDKQHEEYKTPLEEITSALRDKTVKFLSTRDYELQLPDFFFEGSTVKISPREIDEKGALIRVDFGQRGLETEGRLFKKLRKFIQNKLLMSFLALILIIKLIKVKFLFVIPFLFGVGAAKKLFLKLLLFLVPAFANVFKLCSSYYTSHGNRLHHHHHQIAHHHHHVPVPVPVPTYYGPNHHHPHHEEEHAGYDYPHPQIQFRKDIEELKEWGIKPLDEPYDDRDNDPGLRPVPDYAPLSPVYHGNTYTVSQNIQTSRPPGINPYQDKYPGTFPTHAQSLAYNGYIDEHPKFNRRTSLQSPIVATGLAHTPQVPAGAINIQVPASSSVNVVASSLPNGSLKTNAKTPYNVYPQQQIPRPVQQVQIQRIVPQSQPPAKSFPNVVAYDDTFYGPILERLDDIFGQLRFVEENCRERLVCSMYKNPGQYSPHSNLVSNELSRDPQELKRDGTGSSSSQRFHRYVGAARLGQDGGDCLRTYPCQINTE